ncbi:MAG TPA: hypothetical protein VFL63_07110 [Rhodanobacteraceae bacterium]|nr:hypothetical protein [Rhodanobacteraceae bacterium]
MNTKLIVMAMAAAGVAMVVSASAFAGQASPGQNTTSQANTTTAATNAPKKAERAVPAPGSRNCIQSTGSHIPAKKGQCLPVVGNSYSQQDIQRTGAANIGQALQMLDPSVTVHGH